MSTIFLDGVVLPNTKLEMVNNCLLAIGEMPLLEGYKVGDAPIGSDVDVARRIVEHTMAEVQLKGWYFNTDNNYAFMPDYLGMISLPGNILRLDIGHYSDGNRYILRGNRLYDRVNNTFKIDKPIIGDVIWLVDYEELPISAFSYISLRAARKFQQRVIGSQELSGFTQLDEQEALIELQRTQMQYQDYNMRAKELTRSSNMYIRGNLYGN